MVILSDDLVPEDPTDEPTPSSESRVGLCTAFATSGTFDPETGLHSTQAPHASVLGILALLKTPAVAGTIFAIGAPEPMKAIYHLLAEKIDSTYKTPNFAVHYVSRAKAPQLAPRADADYLASTSYRGAPVAGHPRFITDLGRFLEEAMRWLPDVNCKVGSATLIRWAVFVIPLADAYGDSGIGGPVRLHHTFSFPEVTNLEYEMRRTAIHELIHVDQDDYFSGLGLAVHDQAWWMESTAEYLSTLLATRKMGIPTPDPFRYLADPWNQPALGWDAGPKNFFERRKMNQANISFATHSYSYARLMDLMADHGLNMPREILAVNRKGAQTEAGIDAHLKTIGSGLGLHQYHMMWARALYHDNLWTAADAGDAFARNCLGAHTTALTRIHVTGRRNKAQNRTTVYDETTLTSAPVLAELYPFTARNLPAARDARLVVQVQAPPGAIDIDVMAFELRGNPNPTYPGPPPKLRARAVGVHGVSGRASGTTRTRARRTIFRGPRHRLAGPPPPERHAATMSWWTPTFVPPMLAATETSSESHPDIA